MHGLFPDMHAVAMDLRREAEANFAPMLAAHGLRVDGRQRLQPPLTRRGHAARAAPQPPSNPHSIILTNAAPHHNSRRPHCQVGGDVCARHTTCDAWADSCALLAAYCLLGGNTLQLGLSRL